MSEFGRIATVQDNLLYALVLEQRKTNELLTELLARIPAPETAPVEAQAEAQPKRRKRGEG